MEIIQSNPNCFVASDMKTVKYDEGMCYCEVFLLMLLV